MEVKKRNADIHIFFGMLDLHTKKRGIQHTDTESPLTVSYIMKDKWMENDKTG